MLIVGSWLTCEDGVTRPVVRAKLQGANDPHSEYFLIDSGADETVLSAFVLEKLGLPPVAPPPGMIITGVGGSAKYAVVETFLEFTGEENKTGRIHGQYTALIDKAAIDMSILGREVLDMFDVILSKRRNEVYLLAKPHTYVIGKV